MAAAKTGELCAKKPPKIGPAPSLSCNLDLQPEPGVAITGRGRGGGPVCNHPFFGRPARITELEIAAASPGSRVRAPSRPAQGSTQPWGSFCQQWTPRALGGVVAPVPGSGSRVRARSSSANSTDTGVGFEALPLTSQNSSSRRPAPGSRGKPEAQVHCL